MAVIDGRVLRGCGMALTHEVTLKQIQEAGDFSIHMFFIS